jgi:hypothetical protein
VTGGGGGGLGLPTGFFAPQHREVHGHGEGGIGGLLEHVRRVPAGLLEVAGPPLLEHEVGVDEVVAGPVPAAPSRFERFLQVCHRCRQVAPGDHRAQVDQGSREPVVQAVLARCRGGALVEAAGGARGTDGLVHHRQPGQRVADALWSSQAFRQQHALRRPLEAGLEVPQSGCAARDRRRQRLEARRRFRDGAQRRETLLGQCAGRCVVPLPRHHPRELGGGSACGDRSAQVVEAGHGGGGVGLRR